MKKSILILSAFAAVIAGSAFQLRSDNGKAGYTGSSGETTCSSCHAGSSTGSVYLTSTMANWRYVPGQTYTINVIVKQTGKPLFGFDFEALTSANANAGTMTVTNSAKTHILTKTVSSVSRNNMVHQLNAGLHADSAVFTFNWTAPATNIGNVTFYYAGVAANNNGSDGSGDNTYTGSKVVSVASLTGVNEIKNELSALKVSTLDAEHKLLITFNATETSNAIVSLYDLSGREIAHINKGTVRAGDVSMEMDLPGSINNGIYIVTVNAGSQILSRKTSIQF
jgi:hypothetical protein